MELGTDRMAKGVNVNKIALTYFLFPFPGKIKQFGMDLTLTAMHIQPLIIVEVGGDQNHF